MQLEIDIEKQLRNGQRGFHLHSRFTAKDNALVLFGPSGSGKTLTLKAMAGLLTPDAGRIVIDGAVLFDAQSNVDVPTRKRNVGFVFQHYALFPHLSVRQNVAFGLKRMFRTLSAEACHKVDNLIDLFGLSGVASSLPGEISGGQQQRTALARVLVQNPGVLLLDEPFSALDQPLRVKMRRELKRILSLFDIPTVMVTHDPAEAADFAESIIFYRHGAVHNVLHRTDLASRGTCPIKSLRRLAEATFAA